MLRILADFEANHFSSIRARLGTPNQDIVNNLMGEFRERGYHVDSREEEGEMIYTIFIKLPNF